MIYDFECSYCHHVEPVHGSIKHGPPDPWRCDVCAHGFMERIWTVPHIVCVSEPDIDDTPVEKRVSFNTAYGDTQEERNARQRAYQRDIEKKRQAVREGGNRKDGLKMTHSVPAELYHERIKVTGDKNYWSDPKNRDRHRSTKIE